ncbi:LexA family protein [Acidisarcina polymorpha]|uniref:LexA family protein n=1 Tax=Acidisarcina polymorpha TaxID=2211140 RepID=UPI0039C86A6E
MENLAATFLMRVDVDSMKGAGISGRRPLVVDRSAKAANGCVVVVAVNGAYTVKRLRCGPDSGFFRKRSRSYGKVAETETARPSMMVDPTLLSPGAIRLQLFRSSGLPQSGPAQYLLISYSGSAARARFSLMEIGDEVHHFWGGGDSLL